MCDLRTVITLVTCYTHYTVKIKAIISPTKNETNVAFLFIYSTLYLTVLEKVGAISITGSSFLTRSFILIS